MVSKIFSSAQQGVEGVVVEVEANLQSATPLVQITGLPGSMVKESRDRLCACFSGLGFDIPSGRIVVHLSPANAPKQGSHFDLAIALATLGVEHAIDPSTLKRCGAVGELTLDGRVRWIPGAVSLIDILERDPRISEIFIPWDNAHEAELICSEKSVFVRNIGECIDHLTGKNRITDRPLVPQNPPVTQELHSLDDIRGQAFAKRALQVALSGSHHFLMVGSPGVGKTLIAHTAEGLLPPLNKSEKITLHKIYGFTSSQETFNEKRPFRTPHHSVSANALLGGGSGAIVSPGEISRAHTGVLFLDEFPEFQRDAIEGLREPLQNGTVSIHRTQARYVFPARFTLIAAMNPCPCGYSLSTTQRCKCPPDKVRAYRKRISGPILDRIEIGVVLQSPNLNADTVPELSHKNVLESIERTHALQSQRQKEVMGAHDGSPIPIKNGVFSLPANSQTWLQQQALRTQLSLRSVHKIIRVARTIADLAGEDHILHDHVLESWGLRCFSSLEPFSISF